MTGKPIAENIEHVRSRIKAACIRAGRDPEKVKLVAVSKTVSPADAVEAVTCGVTDLGENRAQDIIAKHDLIGSKAVWHFIGHLQRNKVKLIVPFVELIHSVDSLPLADEISRRAGEVKKEQEILVEVNISGETEKYGLREDQVFAFIKQVMGLKNLRIAGLMTMAPLGVGETEARTIFRSLRHMAAELPSLGIKAPLLSMGMTDDFEIACEEGSDIVRVGRAIFGEAIGID